MLKKRPSAWTTVFEWLSGGVAEAALTSSDLTAIAVSNQMALDALTALLHRLHTIKSRELTPGNSRALIAVFWKSIEGDPFGSYREYP